MKFFGILCAVFLMLLNVNKSDGHESPSIHVLNIIVILDTSDRVNPPGQIERDKDIVTEIVTQFEPVVEVHINQSDELAYKDSFTVVVPEQPGVPPIPWEIMEKLTIDDPGDCDSCGNYDGFLENLEQQKNALLAEISKLYDFVGQQRQTGSDIYEWFELEAKDYFDEDKRNLIICLSDGYLNFDRSIEARRSRGTFMRVRELRDDPDWENRIRRGEGLKPIGEDFSSYNVKFLMLEIAPQSERGTGIPYPQDFRIIKAYWNTWLKSMGIKDANFIKQGRPVVPAIRSLISAESQQE